MSINYPLQIPSTGGYVEINLRISLSVGETESPYTFAGQTQLNTGMRWMAGVQCGNMKRDDAEEWVAFLLALKGKHGTFSLADPWGASPRGAIGTSSPLLNGAHAAGAEQLVTDGWEAGVTGVLKKGSYLNLGPWLHKVVNADVDSDGSGAATLDIQPPLRLPAADNETVLLQNTKGLFRLTSNDYQLANISGPQDAPIYVISFDAKEAL